METQYYRTFIGLPLGVEPHALRARSRLITRLERERISWVKPERYHVTLRFIGDTKESDIRRIGEALKAEVNVPGQTRLELTGLSSFGPHKRPRVIWVGFEETDFFELLKRDVDRALELCAIPATVQPFRAHLTLGRIRNLDDLPLFYQTVNDMKQQFTGSVLFEKLVFFRSILGPKGPEYQKLEEILFRMS